MARETAMTCNSLDRLPCLTASILRSWLAEMALQSKKTDSF
jgi:hypothetical protein